MMRNILFLLFLFPAFLSAQDPCPVQEYNPEYDSVSLSPAEMFVKDNFPYIHMADWKPGMRFIVMPNNNGFTTRLNLIPGQSKPNSDKILQKDYELKIFTLTGLEERIISSTEGVLTETYVIFDCEGSKFEYKYEGSIEELRETRLLSNIRNLVYLDEIDKAKELLLDKELFILTNKWMKKEEGTEGVYDWYDQYVPVKISSIELGIPEAPVKMIFTTTAGDEYFLIIRFSGINKFSGLSGEDFAKVFSFSDPHIQYSSITDEIWRVIQQGNVRRGMTKQECELSWGKPETINKSVSNCSSCEQWLYEETSLIFDNDRVIDIKN